MSFIRKLRQKTRGARLQAFRSFAAEVRQRRDSSSGEPLRIVDLGGTPAFWENWWKVSEADALEITLINNHDVDQSQKDRDASARFIKNENRDATTLTVEYLRQFDIIFSNSFFEHLGERSAQRELAAKIVESGQPYFVQVPNKHSPVDPHHPFAPFFALLPFSVRARLLTISAFRPGEHAVSIEEAKAWQGRYAPLGLGDMRRLFTDATFQVERPLGVPMSILASRSLVGAELRHAG